MRGRFTATLKVTYAGGVTDSQDRRRRRALRRGQDRSGHHGGARPRPSRAEAAPARVPSRSPCPRRTRRRPRRRAHEYRVNGGDWAGYSAPLRREQPGMYLIEYRSTDQHRQRRGDQGGHVHDRRGRELPAEPQRRVQRQRHRPEVAASCATTPTAVVLRGRRAADEGPCRRHDRHARPTRRTCSCRRRLSGAWQIQTKLDVSTLVNEGEQAGLVLWNSENPNNVREDHLHLQRHASRSTSGPRRATTGRTITAGRRSRRRTATSGCG